MKKKRNSKDSKNIKKEHINKISKLSNAEDLFLLTNNFEKKDYNELKESIKKLNIDKNILKLVKDDKNPQNLKENIFKKLIEDIENKYSELKDKGTEYRKKGKDTLLAELKLMSLQYKLKLFKATRDKKDYLKIKKIILEVEKNLI